MSKSTWDQVQFYFDGDSYFESIIALFRKAQKEILVETYIFNLDHVGQAVLLELQAARARGVAVHLMIDGIGSLTSLHQLESHCRQAGIDFRVYHPVGKWWLIPLHKRPLRRFIHWMWRLNKRNHRKSIVVDQTWCWIGSFNISQVHSKKYSGDEAWRDTGVLLQGQEVQTVRQAFFETWRSSRHLLHSNLKGFLKLRKKRQKIQSPLLRLNSSLRSRYQLKRDLRRRIAHATTRVLITNAYFIPTRSIVRALCNAAKKGCFVALCLPAKTDVNLVRVASWYLYNRLLKAGVQIFEYEPTVLHAKTLVIDEWATVGSHNLNHRSIKHDLELDAALEGPSIIHPLVAQWDRDVRKSRAITLDKYRKLSRLQRWMSRLAYYVRFWL